MPIEAVDHINIRTANVEGMARWYEDILEMPKGPRPDFGFPGAWLYLGDLAFIHLVGVDTMPEDTDPKLEHFALRATGLADFLDRLQSNDVAYQIAEVPSLRITPDQQRQLDVRQMRQQRRAPGLGALAPRRQVGAAFMCGSAPTRS